MNDRLVSAKSGLATKTKEAEEAVQRVETRWFPHRILVLSRVWLLTQLCTLALVISGFAVGSDGTNAGYAFIGVWVALLAIFLGVVGTLILRKHRTPEHHGQLVGMSFMMAHIMLISGVAAGTGRECNVEGTSAAEKAVGAFSIVLFFLYLFFSMLLMKWKQDLLDIMDLDDEEDTGIEMNGDDDDLDSASLGLNGNGESASARPGNASEEGGDLKMV